MPKIVTISPTRTPRTAALARLYGATGAAFARKSVKLRRGKKVLTQDMTHNSWLHSALLLLAAAATVRQSKNGHVRYELGAKDVLSHFIFFVKEMAPRYDTEAALASQRPV